MIIKKEEWEAAGKLRKEELHRCQVCEKESAPEKLYARHLSYKEPLTEKSMMIMCSDCNYRTHLAETRLKEQLTQRNDALREDLKLHEGESEALVIAPIFRKYVKERARLTAEAIFDVVGLYAIPNRGTLDHLFSYPNIDEYDIIRKGKDLGVWEILSYAPIVKKMREDAARAEKEKRKAERAKKIAGQLRKLSG